MSRFPLCGGRSRQWDWIRPRAQAARKPVPTGKGRRLAGADSSFHTHVMVILCQIAQKVMQSWTPAALLRKRIKDSRSKRTRFEPQIQRGKVKYAVIFQHEVKSDACVACRTVTQGDEDIDDYIEPQCRDAI